MTRFDPSKGGCRPVRSGGLLDDLAPPFIEQVPGIPGGEFVEAEGGEIAVMVRGRRIETEDGVLGVRPLRPFGLRHEIPQPVLGSVKEAPQYRHPFRRMQREKRPVGR